MTPGQTFSSAPLMPNFSQSFAGFRHTVDSALEVLVKLGVPSSRITLRMAGPGTPSRWITSQSPVPGTPLTQDQVVTLAVSGIGFCQNLPVGMWDKGDEQEPGTAELLEFLDDPLQKADHWIREGALLFNISSDNLAACSRWISLFGLQPDVWPSNTWYHLSLLLPSIQALAGTEKGIRFALDLVFGLPLYEVLLRPSARYFRSPELSSLGRVSSRLSIDCVVGNQLEELSKLVLVLGPVPLETYYQFQEPDYGLQLKQLLTLVLPCFRAYTVQWSILDATKPPRLGFQQDNSVLGLNSYLGRPQPVTKDVSSR